jgi:hypothetical protein
MKHKLLAVNSGWYLEHPLLGKADIPPRVITGLAGTWLVIFLDMIRDISIMKRAGWNPAPSEVS